MTKLNKIILHISVLILTYTSWSQPKLKGIYSDTKPTTNARTNFSKPTSVVLKLQLPFFDNFHKSNPIQSPDSLLWLNGGGVKISNTMNFNIPDFNAAVFDGTDEEYVPYSYSNPQRRGITDTLTSHYIDLSSVAIPSSSSDSVLSLSYFVQNGGYGEVADGREGDELKLFFKNKSGVWQEVWSRKDSIPNTTDTLIIDKYYKEFYRTVYKARLYLNTFDDSVNYVKKIYPLVANYFSTDKVLKDSLARFYSIWTGNESFSNTQDSIDYYRKIYKGDTLYQDHYKNFFKTLYHKSLNFTSTQDSLDYFKQIYPGELFPKRYYKYFFGKGDPNDSIPIRKIPIVYKNMSVPPTNASPEFLLSLKRDSINYYRGMILAQNKDFYKSFIRYDYYFDKPSDTSYLHDKFQMKFQAHGRQSGSFDVWGLDYVYLRRGNINSRGIANINFEYSVTGQLPSILSEFVSMPINQITDKTKFIDSVTCTVYSFTRDESATPPALSFGFKGDISPQSAFNTPTTTPILVDDNYYISYKIKTPANLLLLTSKPVALVKSTVYCDSFSISLRANDTISTSYTFSDYYSYDDGSAERAFEISGKYSEIAYKYHVETPDTLSHIRFFFPKIIKSNDGRSILLKIWSNVSKEGDGRRQDSVLYSKIENINYQNAKDSIDGFIEFRIDSAIVIKDTFYVGFEMISSDQIYLGFDLNPNISSTENLLYNTNGTWKNFTAESGNLMLRPVFGKYIKNGSGREGELDNFNIYNIFPNPTEGKELEVLGPMPIHLRLFDPMGNEYGAFSYDENTGKVSLHQLKPGIYLLKIFGPKFISYKKIIID